MKKATHIICLVLSIVLILSLATACGGGTKETPSPSQQPGGTSSPAASPSQSPVIPPPSTPPPSAIPSLVPLPEDDDVEYIEHFVYVGNERITTLDTSNPASSTLPCNWIYNMIYNTVVDILPDGSYIPSLAKSWDTSDYQTFTFKLRDDIYFHNGEKFKADDVAFTIDRAKNSPGTQIFDRLNGIESYNIVNDYEIVIKLSKVNVDFLASIAWQACGILNRAACEKDPEQGYWIGTGSWIVQEVVSNDHTTVRRNEDYWGDIPVTTKFFTFRTVSEEAARYVMLDNGEAHAVNAVNPVHVPTLDSNQNLDYTTIVFDNAAYLGFNLNVWPTSDINFRRAVAHAIRHEDIVDIARNGFAVIPEDGAFWGYRTEFRNTGIPRIPYDLDKAKSFLALTDYKGEPVEIITSNPAAVFGVIRRHKVNADVGK